MTCPSSRRCLLVTGAGGFLGAAVARRACERGFRITALLDPRTSSRRLSEGTNLRIVRGTLSRPEEWAEQVFRDPPEALVHLAWHRVHGEDRNDPARLGRNLTDTLILCRTLADRGCLRWLFCGSQAEIPVTREETPSRSTLYGEEKEATRILTRGLARSSGALWTWLRLFAAYGPDDHTSCLIPSLTEALLRGTCPPLTEGLQRWDYLHVEDAAEAFLACLEHPEATGTFDLGSGCSIPVREVAALLRDLAAPEVSLRLGERSLPEGTPEILEARTEKLRKATGWIPQIPMEEGLRQTVLWHRAHLRKEPPSP